MGRRVDRARPHALAHEAGVGIGWRKLVEHAQDRLVEADVDHLAASGGVAGAQREQRAERPVKPREVIGEGGRARRHRRAVGHAREVGEAAEGVCDAGEARPLAVRAGLAVARDAHHDQALVDGA